MITERTPGGKERAWYETRVRYLLGDTPHSPALFRGAVETLMSKLEGIPAGDRYEDGSAESDAYQLGALHITETFMSIHLSVGQDMGEVMDYLETLVNP
jgi:hypothetical protein